jgi:hypothetical protein
MPDDPDRPVRPDGEDATPSDEPADSVEEADKESFPASDPPASWAGGDGH